MYSNEMIDSYIYGDNSGDEDSAARGQAMAIFNIMEILKDIRENLSDINTSIQERK